MSRICCYSAILLLTVCAAPFVQAADSPGGAYHIAETWRLGGDGGWDYVTFDPASKQLYVARSTHVMVIDTTTGKLAADIKGQGQNHGVAIVSAAGRGFITDSRDGSVWIFDLKSNKVLGKIEAAEDADGAIYDPSSNKVLVSCGDANALVAIAPDVDPKSGKAAAKVDLGGKPEFLAADADKIYVALVNKSEIAVIDSKTMKVVHRWPTAPGGSPSGLAIDAEHHHLFVGCRQPQKLIVISTEDGKLLADPAIGAGVDATCFGGDVFCSCRDGSLAIARETSPGKFQIVQTVTTRPNAKTMGVDPATRTAFVPAAEYSGTASVGGRTRPRMQPGSFSVLVVKPGEK
jgi:hypothetical protein